MNGTSCIFVSNIKKKEKGEAGKRTIVSFIKLMVEMDLFHSHL